MLVLEAPVYNAVNTISFRLGKQFFSQSDFSNMYSCLCCKCIILTESTITLSTAFPHTFEKVQIITNILMAESNVLGWVSIKTYRRLQLQ